MPLLWVDSARHRWSYDSNLANQRAHSSGHGDWFRNGHEPKPDQQARIWGLILGILKEKCALSSAGFELGERRHSATADMLLENGNNMGVTEPRAGVRPGPLPGSSKA